MCAWREKMRCLIPEYPYSGVIWNLTMKRVQFVSNTFVHVHVHAIYSTASQPLRCIICLIYMHATCMKKPRRWVNTTTCIYVMYMYVSWWLTFYLPFTIHKIIHGRARQDSDPEQHNIEVVSSHAHVYSMQKWYIHVAYVKQRHQSHWNIVSHIWQVL